MADLAHEAQQSRQTQPDFVIKVQNVSKIFHTPSQANLSALTDIELDVRPGEFVTVVGPSGCGKSTLLKLIAGFSPVFGRSDSLSRRRGTRPQYSSRLRASGEQALSLAHRRGKRRFRPRAPSVFPSGPRAAGRLFYQARRALAASKNIIPRNSRAAWASALRSSARSLTNRRLY